ncbi:MAG: damage-inducible protein DinB [Acidobacteria bacterium]|nr:damage-inducible protein DinB [Acidobacteriota bacterium]
MRLADLFIADIEREAEATRHVIERVPLGRNDWKPHEKSMDLGRLTVLVATMVSWVEFMVNSDELDIAPVNGPAYQQPAFESREQVLQLHEDGLQKAIAALKKASDEHLEKTWKFMARGHVISELPRHINIRDMVINHLAHHRGQLTVYLRLTSASVPAIYGPSADEGKEMFA